MTTPTRSEHHLTAAKECLTLADAEKPQTLLWQAYQRQFTNHQILSRGFKMLENEESNIEQLKDFIRRRRLI